MNFFTFFLTQKFKRLIVPKIFVVIVSIGFEIYSEGEVIEARWKQISGLKFKFISLLRSTFFITKVFLEIKGFKFLLVYNLFIKP